GGARGGGGGGGGGGVGGGCCGGGGGLGGSGWGWGGGGGGRGGGSVRKRLMPSAGPRGRACPCDACRRGPGPRAGRAARHRRPAGIPPPQPGPRPAPSIGSCAGSAGPPRRARRRRSVPAGAAPLPASA